MSQGLDLRHGGFHAPRVPFDLRCVILAALGYGVTLLLDTGLGRLFETGSPIGQIVDLIATQLDRVAFLGVAFRRGMSSIWGHEPYRLDWLQTLATAVGFLAVWSLFGGAVLRTAALRLTRDEPLSLKDALAFGAANWFSFLRAPVMVVGFAAFFAGCIWLVGVIVSIPLVGSSLLILPLFPLVLVAGLLVVLALAGGLVGLPLIWSGIVVEQNGPLEALSRGFSYLFARPFRFFFGYFLLFVLMSLLLVVSGHFETATKATLKSGIWKDDLNRSISRPPPGESVLESQVESSERIHREEQGIANLRNIDRTRWWDSIGFFWMWLLLSMFLFGFKGYALYVFLGGTVSLYLHLRREVDGTDEEEIYPESEQDLAAADRADPRWVSDAPDPESNAGEGPDGASAEPGPPDTKDS